MRLIDADALLENQKLMNLTRCNGKTLLNEVIKEITRIIKEAPTIEQKSGEWIEDKEYDYAEWDICYNCSICGRSILVTDEQTTDDYPYCHCGAKMESEETHKRVG